MKRSEILDAAKACVCGDRDQQYGSPEDSFQKIADLWTDFLGERLKGRDMGATIEPEDVAAMMVLFKVARIATGNSKDDNWIDIAGYAACGAEVSE